MRSKLTNTHETGLLHAASLHPETRWLAWSAIPAKTAVPSTASAAPARARRLAAPRRSLGLSRACPAAAAAASTAASASAMVSFTAPRTPAIRAAVRAAVNRTQEYATSPLPYPHDADSGDGTRLPPLTPSVCCVQCGVNCGCIFLEGCAEEKDTGCRPVACCGQLQSATDATPASPKPAHEMER